MSLVSCFFLRHSVYQSSHEPLGKQQYQKQLCKSKNPRVHSYTACGLSDNSEDMCNK